MPNKERQWRTPRKKGRLRSNSNVKSWQARIKIFARPLTRANRTRKRSNRSTKAKARGKARVRKDWKQQEPEGELETRRGTYLSVKAREEERELEKVETNSGTQLNVICREPEQVTLENTGKSSRLEIKGTGETWAETRRKCTPAKWPGPEVLQAGPIR